MTKSVFVAMPNYNGDLNDLTKAAVARLEEQITARGWTHRTRRHIGDSLITRARNVLLAEFLESGCSDMLCLDDDIAWDGDEAMRILDAPVDFAGGVYRAKTQALQYFVRYCEDRPMLMADPATGLLEVEGLPAGFLKLTRACVLRMVEAHADLWFYDRYAPNARAWALFDFHLDKENHHYWGEDFIFCNRWRALGGKIWIDPDLTLKHVGKSNKEGQAPVFIGNLGHWLRTREEAA